MRASTRHRINQPRRRLLSFATALTAGLLCAPALLDPLGGALQAQQPSATPSVAGRLIGPDGAAASGLEVRLIPSPSSYDRRLRELGETDAIQVVDRTRADAEGHFELVAPRPGPYRIEIVAARPGTTPRTAVAPVYTDLLPLAERQPLPAIRMPRMHDLVVGVRDDAGEPVEGALVVARATRWSNRERQSPESPEVHRGRPWQRPQPPPQPQLVYPIFGRAVARTDAEGLVRLSLPTPDANAFVFAHGFELRAGMVEGRGMFELRRDPGVTLRVTGPLGTPVPRAVIRVAENIAVPLAVTNELGEATVGLNSGEAIPFQVETEDRSFGRTEPIELPGDGSARPHVVEVRMTPAVELRGRAVDAETRQGIDGAVVWLNGRPGDHALADADGGFTLRTRPDIKRLHPAAAAVGYRTRTMEVPREPLGGRAGLSIELKAATRITGTVTDASGSPVAGARILVDRVDPRQPGGSITSPATSYQWRSAYGMDHQAVSMSDGTFRLAGLDSGVAHQVTVEAPGYVRTSLRLSAAGRMGTSEPLRIVVNRGRRAWGTVADAESRPVQGATVVLLPASRNPRGGISLSYDSDLIATTDPEGMFEFSAVGAGDYQLEVDHAEFVSPAPMNVDIPDGEGDFPLGEATLAPGVTIEGVVSGPARRPVANARITANQPGPRNDPARTATTDDAGRFRIGGLRDRLADVTVEADGYAHSYLKGVRPSANDPLEIELNHGATLTGRVVGTGGEGVPGVGVNLSYHDGRDFARRSGPPPSAKTNADGRFRFEALASATWVATVFGSKPGNAAESDPIRLQTGDVHEIELVLGASGAKVEGVVTNHRGDPVPHAQVQIISNSEAHQGPSFLMGSSWATSTDLQGRFASWNIPVGSAVVVVSHAEYRDAVHEVTIDPDGNEVSLTLAPGLEITGTVRSANGGPIAFAAVKAQTHAPTRPGQQSAGGPSLALRIVQQTPPIETLADAEGAYRLTGLNPGAYRLRAWADGYGSSASGLAVRLDEVSAAGADILLHQEATVKVRIVGAGADGVNVRAVQDDEYREATQLASDQYRIDGLGPGDWTIFADEFGGRTTRQVVSLASGDEALVELRFEEGLRLSGQVTVAGQPASGATLVLIQPGGTQSRGAPLDQGGRFELDGLQPGGCIAFIQAANGAAYTRRFDLEGNQDLRFDLEPPGTLTGLVLDARTGQPLREAFVSPVVDIGLAEPVPTGIARTDSAGRFQLMTAPGDFEVLVGREGFSEQRLAMELAPAENRQGLIFELEPGPPSQTPP